MVEHWTDKPDVARFNFNPTGGNSQIVEGIPVITWESVCLFRGTRLLEIVFEIALTS